MSNVAYVRVSTEEQNEARQKEALARELGMSHPTLDRLISLLCDLEYPKEKTVYWTKTGV